MIQPGGPYQDQRKHPFGVSDRQVQGYTRSHGDSAGNGLFNTQVIEQCNGIVGILVE